VYHKSNYPLLWSNTKIRLERKSVLCACE